MHQLESELENKVLSTIDRIYPQIIGTSINFASSICSRRSGDSCAADKTGFYIWNLNGMVITSIFVILR